MPPDIEYLWLKSSVFHKTSMFAASQVLLGPKILTADWEHLWKKAVNGEWGGWGGFQS